MPIGLKSRLLPLGIEVCYQIVALGRILNLVGSWGERHYPPGTWGRFRVHGRVSQGPFVLTDDGRAVRGSIDICSRMDATKLACFLLPSSATYKVELHDRVDL